VGKKGKKYNFLTRTQKPNDSASNFLAYSIIYDSFSRVRTHSSQCTQ